MFSITFHLVYIAILSVVTLVLTYQGLVNVYTSPVQAVTYCLLAIGAGTSLYFLVRRWLHLEFLWSRAMHLLVPNKTNVAVHKLVRGGLNTALSKKSFRYEMKRALNKPGVFKFFTEHSVPVVQLDIAFHDSWNNHNYLRSALGWIAACMPASITCQTLERKDTRLVFRFIHRDLECNDAQGLRDAIGEWTRNMQRVLVLHLNECSIQDLQHVPQKITRQQVATSTPRASTTVFEEDVLLAEENIRLHIGFDGSTYYTYFEDGVTTQVHGRREYQSWAALWSVWRHMNEVQVAFQQPAHSSSGALPNAARSA